MLLIFAVRDVAVEAFGTPIFAKHRGEVLRSFRDECGRKESAIGAHPGDYELYQVGTFDEVTGVVAPVEIERIARGGDYVQE